MQQVIPSRRHFILGASATLITAPAVVRAASLMPIKAFADPLDDWLRTIFKRDLYEELIRSTHAAFWYRPFDDNPIARYIPLINAGAIDDMGLDGAAQR